MYKGRIEKEEGKRRGGGDRPVGDDSILYSISAH
jgi:hypothetical protein